MLPLITPQDKLSQGAKEQVRSIAMHTISNLHIISIDHFGRENHPALTALLNQDILNKKDIQAALEPIVLRQARQDYRLMTRNPGRYKTFADHVGRPDCLGYALLQGEFSQADIAKIPFDHGETPESFPDLYGGRGVLKALTERLLNPPAPLRLPLDSCCCSCYH